MKLTKSAIKQIIKEELEKLLYEQSAPTTAEIEKVVPSGEGPFGSTQSMAQAAAEKKVLKTYKASWPKVNTCVYQGIYGPMGGTTTGCSAENNYTAIVKIAGLVEKLALEVETHAHRR